MAGQNLSWEHVVQMCRHLHPEEEEEVVAGVEAQQLDLEAAEAEVAEAVAVAAERAEGRLAATRAEIANAMAELADARAELAEARAAMAAPPADAVIHDIMDEDAPILGRFDCADDQLILVTSFETLAGDAQRRHARLAEEEANSYAIAMAAGLLCSDLDSLQRRGPSPARVEQENRDLAVAIAARDEAMAEVARDRARFVAQLAGLQAAAQAKEAVAAAQAAAEEAAALAAAEEANSMARTLLWDSSLAESLERHRREGVTNLRRARRAECAKRSRSRRRRPLRQNPSKEIFSELDETFAQGPIFARSFQKTEEITKWGHEAARGWPARPKPWPRRPTPWAPRVAPALTFRLLKVSVAKPPVPRATIRKTFQRRAAANPISGIQEIASTLPERGFISGGLYTAMVASGVMSE
ncbi:hypothetical protein QYE76_024081 [Lolium multiflorum]|uniref:Uncharacterized protein n=1 Tax=Lolium multiflorum TaxID=4521 RepID=A0AAD8REF5_LOLMU|nr:hypothetical protein QYE76_024081 [Lolium multiflorum]